MKQSPVKKIAGLFGILLLSNTVIANELQVKPGLWKSTNTRTNPMTMQLETVEETECITPEKAKISVNTFTKDMKEGGSCNTLKDELKGKTLSIIVECTNEMGKSKISGEFTADGDKAHSKMKIEMNIHGQTMNMSMDSKAERVGDCTDAS